MRGINILLFLRKEGYNFLRFIDFYFSKLYNGLAKRKTMIEIKKLSYKVIDRDTGEEKVVLSDLNLSFPKGKITVITGHNGSGKSTLIKLIMGTIKPTEGEVLLNGASINDLSVSDRANLGLTMAFQQPVRFKGLLVRDLFNIATKSEYNIPKACEYLAQVGLCAKDYIDRPLDDTLSGGELKRIELALALAKGGEVFLFDEPEAGIDLWSFDNLVTLFRKLEGKTVLIVSHQKKLIEIADNILLLSANEPALMGEKKDMMEVLSNPKCARLNGGDNE